jgi:murein DD-endopeptidase MepM/ murein hydrolase activator NlpD
MASNLDSYNKTVGCSAGKTILVDPNKFDGQSSSSNISVPLEDLSIYVQLETNKRARTVLQAGSQTNTSAVKINFIEGSKDETTGNQRVLTTKYTNLTTDFSTSSDSESLGITSIDIDFNTSYAPLVVINFIDPRGTSIFQNEDMLNGKNKFATLFQLPYPIFTLTIKGYYGMPVKYDLHMTKFNAKFNSKTGNFEITANFIGYTYAFLSDMLIGFLRAIPHTKFGGDLFKDYKAKRPYTLSIDDLIQAISNIDVNLSKLKAEDPQVQNYTSLNDKLEGYDSFNYPISTFGEGIGVYKDQQNFKFITLRNDFSDTDKLSTHIDTYNTDMQKQVDDFNNNNSVLTIDYNTLNSQNFKIYNDISVAILTSNDQTVKDTWPQVLKDDIPRKDRLVSYLNRQDITGVVTIYDLNDIYDNLNNKRISLEEIVRNEEVVIGEKVREQIKSILGGLDPTIRNIVEIFTAAAEIFMQTLFTVSQTAISESGDKAIREAQLKKLVAKTTEDSLNKLDYKNSSISTISNDTSSGAQDKSFHPWPEYREPSSNNGASSNNNTSSAFVEAFLGKIGVLDVPSDVTELNFIDDLLNAFITSAKIGLDADIRQEKNKSTWYPVSPLDTKIFFENYPYNRIDNTKLDVVVANSVIRAMIYLGVSNDLLTQEEIINFASLEGQMLLEDSDDKIKSALSNLTLQNFIDAKAKYFGNEYKIVNYANTQYDSDGKEIKSAAYLYNYITDNENITMLLPLSHGKDNVLDFDMGISPSETLAFFKSDKTNNIFITNYATSNYLSDTNNTQYHTWLTDNKKNPIAEGEHYRLIKDPDGTMYVKILQPSYLTLFVQPFRLSSSADTSTILNFNDFAKKTQLEFKNAVYEKQIKFKQFGDNFGITEYSTLNYDFDTSPAPFRIGFYEGILPVEDTYSTRTKFWSKRTKGTNFDLSNSKIQTNPEYEKSYFNNDVFPRADIGGNPKGLNKLIKNDQSEIAFPYLLMEDAAGNQTNIFTSRLYYKQKTNYAKAYLFLHSLPFYGLLAPETTSTYLTNPGGVLGNNFVLNTLGHRAGFVSVPRAWAAFVGALLWRFWDGDVKLSDSKDVVLFPDVEGVDPITFGVINGTDSNTGFPTYSDLFVNIELPNTSSNSKFIQPTTLSYCGTRLTNFGFLKDSGNYTELEEVMVQLPIQVQSEFMKIFFEFVENETGDAPFQTIAPMLELIGPNNQDTEWDTKWNNVNNSITTIDDARYISTDKLRTEYNATYGNGKKAIDNYVLINKLENKDGYEASKYNYFAEIKDGSEAAYALNYILSEELILINNSYKIWSDSLTTDNKGEAIHNNIYEPFRINAEDFKLYFNTVIQKLTDGGTIANDRKKNIEQSIFGTDNEEIIKFQLYRTCKNIYDKWIGGTSDIKNLIFRDGLPSRNGLDFEIAKYRSTKFNTPSATEPTFIDSFRFVNRSFKDIGDDLYVNPKEVADNAKFNPNNSFYDIVTNMLSQNYFDFIALPNYINYSNPDELSSMFKPMTALESFNAGATGPSFVCVYAGQTSKHLNFGDSEYPNDGIDFRCGDTFPPQNAIDFSDEKKQYENNVAVFAVNYSQQNQNLFKDITLDQSEFSETAESLKITDEIASKLGENRATYGGQNMYNVYSVRSYKTEVEMMGNAMVQPMMYFQLNNIPMFHGAYMITHVKHAIKPNNMSTVFTGVRIRNVETPLLTVSELYMPLLNSIQAANSGGGATLNSGNGGTFNSEMFIIPDSGVSGLFVDPFENNKQAIVSSLPQQSRTIDNVTREHLGTDFDIVQGTSLKAIYDGVIEYVRYDGDGYGLYVVINYGKINNIVYKSVYGHVSNLDSAIFGFDLSNISQDNINNILKGYNPKISIKKGVIFGKSGGQKGATYLDSANKKYDTAGNSKGVHLHFELRIGDTDKYWYYMKPVYCVPYLPMNAYVTYKAGQTPPVLNSGQSTKKTVLTNSDLAANQLIVKNFLKSKGLNQQQVAGIMGNMQKESSFNPTAQSQVDINGYVNYGLIQWNAKYTTAAQVGDTIQSQLNYLVNMDNYKKFINMSEPKTSVEDSAFLFAKYVEICYKCNGTYDTYKGSYQYARTGYANDFFARFNTQSDPLVW